MRKAYLILVSALLLTGCKNEQSSKENAGALKIEDINVEKQGEWQILFNGKDLREWQVYNKDSVPQQWQIENGVLTFTPAKGDRRFKEYLMTRDKFKNFELQIDWKISEGGNSGILWGVQEMEKYDEPYYTGPEIQILDNQKHPDAQNGLNRTAGALYDMVPPKKDVTKPAGQWNKEVIHINHNTNMGWVELNGVRITEFPVHGERWKKLVQKSKFSDWEDFGFSKEGFIALQDHDDRVWFRNIKIKEL